MHPIDWAILVGFIVSIAVVGLRTRKYTRSVADFLAANRCAGRYILAMGDGMAGMGAIGLVAMFQMHYEGGFSVAWWNSLLVPLNVFVAVTGWVIYRFRQTRALTMAQFFEMRYSKGLRVFAGFLCFLSGVINLGIFPSVGSRFILYYCSLPQSFPVFGWEIPSYPVIMVLLLGPSVALTLVGGQIAVLVTDFLQIVFCYFVFAALIVVLFIKFNWEQITSSIMLASENQSMIDPYKSMELPNYDPFFFLIAGFGAFYTAYAWQGQQAYNSSARNPHEAKMSKIIGHFRYLGPILFLIFAPICAYTMMHHGDFSHDAAAVNQSLANITNDQIRSQMTVPVVLAQLLPVGLMGAFCAVIVAAFVSTHDTYLHSWGSIFLQDVVMPFRKKPFSPRSHLILLKLSILGVALFIFLFSLWYRHQVDIVMFFAVSGIIFLGGSGAVIIGGLYWKRGTTAGAYTSMIIGAVMAVLAFIMLHYWPDIAAYLKADAPQAWQAIKSIVPQISEETFLFTAQEMFFFAMVLSALGYVLVSLLTGQENFNLDRLLHRGEYVVATDKSSADDVASGWRAALGISKDLKWNDKLVYWTAYSYILLFIGIIITGTICNLLFEIKQETWLSFWHGYVWTFFAMTIFVTVWLSIGGFIDLKKMFQRLKTIERDNSDDGTVVHND